MGDLCLEEWSDKVAEALRGNPDFDFIEKQKKYDTIAEKDDQVDIITVKEKITEITAVSHRWNNYVFNEKMIYSRILRKYEDVEKAIFKRLQSDDDPRNKHLSKKLIQEKIDDFTAIKACKEILDGQAALLKYVEDSFNNYKFNLKVQCQLLVELLKQEEVL